MKLSRRALLKAGSAAVIPIGATISFAQDNPPGKPESPYLASDSDREPRALNLNWQGVAGAESYVLVLAWSDGGQVASSEHPFSGTLGRIDGLTPNRIYDCSLVAVNVGGRSPASSPLIVCTRPPRPSAPVPSSELVSAYTFLEYDYMDAVSGSDGKDSMTVALGRDAGAGLSEINSMLPLAGRVADPSPPLSAKYACRIECGNVAAPGGKNLSLWSDAVEVSREVFGELRQPGTDAAGAAAVSLMRGFYGLG